MVAEAVLCAHLAAAIGAVQVSGALGRAAGGAEGGAVLVDFVDDQADEAGKQADEPPIQGRELAPGRVPIHPQGHQHPVVDTDRSMASAAAPFKAVSPPGTEVDRVMTYAVPPAFQA